VKETAQIDSQYLVESYRVIFENHAFLLLHGYGTANEYTTAYKKDGEWKLYNGSIHRRDASSSKPLGPLALTKSAFKQHPHGRGAVDRTPAQR
jgi:hypothetical protein